jgi:hypothetical protein
LIDKYELFLKSIDPINEATPLAGDIEIEESNDHFIVICDTQTKILIDKKTGLIENIIKPIDTLSVSGPYINLRTKGKAVMYSYHEIKDYGDDWSLKKISYKAHSDFVELKIKGRTSNLPEVEFNIIIRSEGIVDIKYRIEKIPDEFIRETGVYFKLENIPDSLSWIRDPYWSYYPADHLSARKGGVALYTSNIKHYRIKPDKGWNLDTKSFYYEGIVNEQPGKVLTHKAKATKENISEYTLIKEDQILLKVLDNGSLSCRLSEYNEKLVLFINNEMDYVDLSWGNYQRNIKLKKEYENDIRLSFH